MGKVKRATKLFNKNHLSAEVENRRKLKGIKKKFVGKRGTRAISGQTSKLKNAAGPSVPNDDEAADDDEKEEDAEPTANFWEEGDDDNDEDGDAGSDVSSDGDLSGDDDEDTNVNGDNEDDDDDDDDEEEDMEDHKAALQRLAEKDPEFFAHLQQNEKDLLNFEDDEDDDDDNMLENEGEDDDGVDGEEELGGDEGDLEEEETRTQTSKVTESSTKAKEITSKMVKAWRTKLETTKSVGALRDVLTAFRAACNVGVEDDRFSCRFKITSSKVFDQVMALCLESVVDVFDSIFNMKSKPGMEPPLPHTSNAWAKHKSLVKSYVGNLVVFLGQATDGQMVGFVLSRVERAVRYIVPFPKVIRQVLKKALDTWSAGEDASRLAAFLVVRRLAHTAPFPFIDQCLKGIYMSYVSVAKYVTPQNLSRLTFMENCIVDLYGVDHASSYQKAFMYIRQLAIHLRNAITMKKKDGYSQVYNWQYVRCLLVWGRVLGEHAGRDMNAGDLSPLVYPLVQVILGTVRLVPSAKFIPLRLVCMQIVNDLCSKTGVYVPSSAMLLDVLDTVHHKLQTVKGSTDKMVDPACTLKTPKQLEGSRLHYESLADRALGLLLEHLSIHCYSIAFPELALPAIVHLKKLAKNSKDVKLKKQLKQMVRRFEENSLHVSAKRDKVNFSPKDFKQIATWVRGEEADDKSPLRRYYHQWKAVEASKTHTYRTVNGGGGQPLEQVGATVGEGEDDDDEEDDEATMEVDEDEPEPVAEIKTHKKENKKKTPTKVKAPVATDAISDDEEDEEDTVTAFDFSEGF